MKTFAERLRYAMYKRDMKQSVLAYKTGLDKSYISRYLSGKFSPKYDKIQILAKALHVSENWLGGYDVEMDELEENIHGVKVPVIGRVAAGIPIEAITDILDYEELSPELFNDGSEYFCLQIKGQSMEPRIYDGDVVVVRKQPDVESGQIAIVGINGDDATCKKVMKQANGILLQPLNPSYAPMYYTSEDIESLPITIYGRVIELRGKL